MTAKIIRIHDYHLKKSLEKQATEILGQIIDYTEVARLGGPIINDTSPCEMIPYHAPDKDPA